MDASSGTDRLAGPAAPSLAAALMAKREELQACLVEYRRRATRTETAIAAQLRAIAEVAVEQSDAIRAELDHCRRQQDEFARRCEALDRLRESLESRSAASTSCDTPAPSAPPDSGLAEELADYRRRYELALADVKELKVQNTALQLQMAKTPAPASAAPVSASGASWEAQKRKILAALEADANEPSPANAAEHIEMADLVRRTDQLLAEKDDELQQLRLLLATEGEGHGGVAMGAMAVGELLDQDAIVQQERENLRRLQSEWEEKLRRAEVELSLERARIARERTVLEEKLHAFESRPAPSSAEAKDKPPKNRWLSRLGLAKGDE